MLLENTPLVSVIVPCYNQAEYLSEALESVFNQTYQNWECIIVNDGSTDYTENVAKEWCEKDKRFIYLKKENGGLSSARNAGIKAVVGEWIQFLDSDDILPTDRFTHVIDRLDSYNDPKFIITSFNLLENNICSPAYCTLNPNNFNIRDIILKWDIEFSIPIHCGLFKKELFNSFTFNEDLKAKEDWLMWIYIFKNPINYLFLPVPLAFYRFHKTNMTKDIANMQNNTIKACRLIISNLDDGLKGLFFERILSDVEENYRIKDNKINFLLNSYTYKLGNFFLAPFKWIRTFRNFKTFK